jgi:Tfp pilus assembly protein PilO
MKPSTKRILSIGLAALFFIGSVIVYTNLISPLFQEISKKRGEVDAKNELFVTQKDAVDQVKNVITESQSMDSIRNSVSLALPEDTDTTEIIHQMNAIAIANQVNFSSFTIETPSLATKGKDFVVKQLGKVRVVMTAVGSYEGIKGFLKGVETNIRIASIESADIRPLAGSSGDVYSLSMKVDFFYQK